MHWAVKRYRSALADQPFQRQIIPREIPPKVYTREKIAVVPWAFMISLIILGLLTAFHKPRITSLSISPVRSLSFNGVGIDKASPTPTQTLTATQSQTPTATSTPIPSLTPTSSETPYPTETPIPTQEEKTETGIFLPEGVVKGERWIDVDLTNQKIIAYQGKNLQNSFPVSTGTWQHPTVTGQYQIYVKYVYADMAGPGYYLPNVPYVMYFYKGYGIHGTYWHNNFGTPMSHGCINLRTEDAAWIFNWSSIGTMVNIHY
jgi:lipoprotein-anchoring transpeptidase ErfK/SrfK